MTIGSSNELMQEGIRDVREGRMADAYRVFKKVSERNPRNEFAWIWISVTSEDRAEKRAALEKALEINPNSYHAQEALKTLNAEEDHLAPTIQDPTSQPTTPMKVVSPQPAPAIENPATPAPVPTPPFSPAPLGQAENTSNPARFGKGETTSNPEKFGQGESTSSPPRIGNVRTNSRPNRISQEDVVSNPFYEMPPELADRVASDRASANTKPYRIGQAENTSNPAPVGRREANTTPKLQDVLTPVNMVNSLNTTAAKKNESVTQADKAANTREKRERLFFRRIRLTALFILAIVVALLAAFFVFNLLQKQSNQLQPTQTVQAGFTSDTASSGQITVQPTITVGPVTTAAPTGSVSATTPQASVAISPTVSAAQQAQAAITKNLQAAATSQASGDYQGAITAYQTVIQTDASNVPANLGLGMLYLAAPTAALSSGTDRYASAVKAFQVVTAQNPNWAGGFSHLGEAFALQGNVKDGIKAYSRSLELDPNGPERWLALAALYDKDNQPTQAKFCRDRANGLTGATAVPITAPAATTAPPTTTKAP